MSCACLPSLLFSMNVACAAQALDMLAGRQSLERRCIECANTIASDAPLPIVAVTPCRLDNKLHSMSFCVCTGAECAKLFETRLRELKQTRFGLVEVLGRVPRGDPLFDDVRRRLHERLEVDAQRRCAQCGLHDWRVRGTKEWSNGRCSRCFREWYCGTECQKARWASHKKECVAGTILDYGDKALKAVCEWKKTSGYINTGAACEAALALFRCEDMQLCARDGCRVRLEEHCALQVEIAMAVRFGADVSRPRAVKFCCLRCATICVTVQLDPKRMHLGVQVGPDGEAGK